MEDPKFALHALHIHFLDCSRPKAQWLHFRKYISNKFISNYSIFDAAKNYSISDTAEVKKTGQKLVFSQVVSVESQCKSYDYNKNSHI